MVILVARVVVVLKWLIRAALWILLIWVLLLVLLLLLLLIVVAHLPLALFIVSE